MPSEAGIADCRVSECDRKTVSRCGTRNRKCSTKILPLFLSSLSPLLSTPPSFPFSPFPFYSFLPLPRERWRRRLSRLCVRISRFAKRRSVLFIGHCLRRITAAARSSESEWMQQLNLCLIWSADYVMLDRGEGLQRPKWIELNSSLRTRELQPINCVTLTRVTNNASCNWVNSAQVGSVQFSSSAVTAGRHWPKLGLQINRS